MKIIKVLLITLLALMTVSLTGCTAIFHTSGTGQITDKTYDFRDFTNINISSAFQYQITQSDTYSVAVTTIESMFAHLDIHQSGNTLYIAVKPFLFNNSNPKVTIAMPQLNKLVISGACEGSATGFVSNNDLEISLSGASRMDADFTAGTTTLDVSGASTVTGGLNSTNTQIELSGASDLNMIMNTGKTVFTIRDASGVKGTLKAMDCIFNISSASDCKLTGSAADTSIEASGASEINSPGLILQSADVKLTGASDASIYTDGTLNININGASTLNYSGNPSLGKISISGDSRLNHK